jgi:hypothetical protein
MTMTEPEATSMPEFPAPSLRRALLNQKRALFLGLGLIVAVLWVSIPLGHWHLGMFIAIGVVLGVLNHVLTEYQVQQAFTSADPVTREGYAKASLLRLGVISVFAFGITAAFWRDGAGTVFGLAFFQMIALPFTAFPLLKEVRSHDSEG